MPTENQIQATNRKESSESNPGQEGAISTVSFRSRDLMNYLKRALNIVKDFENGMQEREPDDPVRLREKCLSLEYQVEKQSTEFTQSKELLKGRYDEDLRRLHSKYREENDTLRKENGSLLAEINKLRANIIGAEFQAWDLESLLKQFNSYRDRWVQFLFDDDAKNGQWLSTVILGIFHTTQKFVIQKVNEICQSMYDHKLSSSNIRFIRGTLQSNYTAFETDIRKYMYNVTHDNPDCNKLRRSYIQFYREDREATRRFDNLFNEMIKISGMLVLGEPNLRISDKFNRDDPATFEVRINSIEKEIICFPGVVLRDSSVPGGAIQKLKVWIAAPQSTG